MALGKSSWSIERPLAEWIDRVSAQLDHEFDELAPSQHFEAVAQLRTYLVGRACQAEPGGDLDTKRAMRAAIDAETEILRRPPGRDLSRLDEIEKVG